jgi:hypothetical protein
MYKYKEAVTDGIYVVVEDLGYAVRTCEQRDALEGRLVRERNTMLIA